MTFPILEAKDPADTVDYELTIGGPGLADDALATVVATGTDVEIESSSFVAPGTVTVWVTGGEPNTRAIIKLACTTTGGRSFERSWMLPIRQL